MKNILPALFLTAASGCFAQVKITASAADSLIPQYNPITKIK